MTLSRHSSLYRKYCRRLCLRKDKRNCKMESAIRYVKQYKESGFKLEFVPDWCPYYLEIVMEKDEH